MKYFLAFFLIFFSIFSAEARQLRVDSLIQAGVSFPFSVVSGDSFRVDNNPGGVTTVKLPGNFLLFNSTIQDAYVNLDNDTVYFDSVGDGGNYGFRFNFASPNAPHNIRIRGGCIRTPSIPGHGLPASGNRCFFIDAGWDITIDSVNAIVDGHNSNIGATTNAGATYNILVRQGNWWNLSESFESREQVQSAAWFSGSLGSTLGDYNVRLDGVKLHISPHVGIMAKGIYEIENCSLVVDGVNRRWDSLFLDQGITGGVGQSADNPYFINGREMRGGSRIVNNKMISGTNRQGARGVLFENLLNISELNGILCSANYIYFHAGPSGENLEGVARGIRERVDGGGGKFAKHVRIKNNTVIGIADNNIATTAIGRELYCLQVPSGQGIDSNIVEGNILIAKNYSTPIYTNNPGATSVIALCAEYSGSWTSGSIIRNNKYQGNNALIWFYDKFNGIPCNNFISIGDSFSFLDPNLPENAGIVNTDMRTFLIGNSSGVSLDNIIQDGFYSGGALDTNIVFQGATQQTELFIRRTFNVYVKDLGNQPVLGASVWAINNYGTRINLPLTTSPGGLSQLPITYWYESSSQPDSLAYNNFTVWAKKGTDSVSAIFTLRHNTYTDTLQLPISSDALLNLDSLIITLLQMDYFGETDRIQIKSYTGLQSYPDSCKFCWSTSGFPDSSVSSCVNHVNQINHTFTDTITPTINESDTLYISSWVFHADSTSGRATYLQYFDEPAVCSLSNSSINFGNVNVGSYKDTTILIKNIGGNSIDSVISFSCNGFSIVSGGGAFSLQDQQTRTVTIRFTPSISGNYGCSFSPDNLCGSISLSGTGVAVSSGQSRKGFRGRR